MGDSRWFCSPVDTTGVGIHIKELSLRLQCQYMRVLGWLWVPIQLLAHCPSSTAQKEKNKKKNSCVEVHGVHLTVNKTDLSWGK